MDYSDLIIQVFFGQCSTSTSRLGFIWDNQTIPLRLTGVLQGAEAYLITVKGIVSPFPPVDFVFAWVKQPRSTIRVILGQANFFKKYHVSLNGLQETFEVMPHQIDEKGMSNDM